MWLANERPPGAINSEPVTLLMKFNFFYFHSFLPKWYYHCCHDDQLTNAWSINSTFFTIMLFFSCFFLHSCFHAFWNNNNMQIYSKVPFASLTNFTPHNL